MNLILSLVALLHSGNAHAADYCYPAGAMCGAVKKVTNNLQTAIDKTCNGDVFVNGTPVVPNTRTLNAQFRALHSATAANPCKYDAAAAPVISMDPAAADGPLLRVGNGSQLILNGVSLAGGHNQSTNGGTGTGGNVFVDVASTLFVLDASVTGGTADLGGGIYAEDQSNVYLKNAVVSGNAARVGASGVDAGHGGGIYMVDSYFLMDESSSIVANEADLNGGGLAITGNKVDGPEHMVQNVDGNVSLGGDGGGVHASNATMCLFRDEHNEALAGNGGGAFFTGTSEATTPVYWSVGPTTDNYAAGMGGGHYIDLGELYVSNNAVNANAASESGGGIRATGGLTDVFLQSGLEISENLALVDGGGIHADADARIVIPFEGPLAGSPGVDLEVYTPGAIIEEYSCDELHSGPVSISDNTAGLDGLVVVPSTSSVGGGIFLDGATLETNDTAIELELARNVAYAKGGAVAMTGGALFLVGEQDSVVVATENDALGGSVPTSVGRGGAFDIDGAGTYAELFLGTIEGNEATTGVGGGVSITNGGSLYLESGSISGNTSESGGGIYVGEGNATLGDVECVIPTSELTCVLLDGNVATDPVLGGGGIATDGAGSILARQMLVTHNEGDVGAAIVANGSTDVHAYTNVVVTDNGGGAGVWAVDVVDAGAVLTCQHCTIAHNDDNGIQATGTATLRQSLVTMHPLGSNIGATVDTTDCNRINTTNVRDATHAFPGLPFGAGAATAIDECVTGDTVDILLQPRPVGISTSPYDVGAYESP
jgi:hypothetical protein